MSRLGNQKLAGSKSLLKLRFAFRVLAYLIRELGDGNSKVMGQVSAGSAKEHSKGEDGRNGRHSVSEGSHSWVPGRSMSTRVSGESGEAREAANDHVANSAKMNLQERVILKTNPFNSRRLAIIIWNCLTSYYCMQTTPAQYLACNMLSETVEGLLSGCVVRVFRGFCWRLELIHRSY